MSHSHHDHGKPEGAEAAVKEEAGCCEACPDAGCAGCACSKVENKTGGCMGGGCGCMNR